MKQEPIFKYLESIAELIPSPFWWLDTNGRWMGLNTVTMKAIGVISKDELIGKDAIETYKDKEIGSKLLIANLEIVRTGKGIQTEDAVVDIATGQPRYFFAVRAPLRNEKDEIIGIVGTSIDITAEKEAEKLRFENEVNRYKAALAEKDYKAALAEKEKFIAEREAERLRLEASEREAEKRRLASEAEKLKLEKEADRLQYENEANKVRLLELENSSNKQLLKEREKARELENKIHETAFIEQEKFREMVGQMMHDMTSPISSIDMIINKIGRGMYEQDRVTLRNALGRISGITRRLLDQYKNKDANEEDSNRTIIVSLALLQIMNEKCEEHCESGVELLVEIHKGSEFVCIDMNVQTLKRMVSNLVNNAVDAVKSMKKKDGLVKVELWARTKEVLIIINDNGYGMPEHIQKKFTDGISVTEGKGNAGHGFGLKQVKDAIASGYGRHAVLAGDTGTSIHVFFPKVESPAWLATKIKLTKDDTVVILDDDESIHGAWDSRFALILQKIPELKLKHFTVGQEVIDYINNLSTTEKENTFLLTDYELLEQEVTGLSVIAQTRMHRAILVTSYSAKAEIQQQVIKVGVKLLPKELAYAVPIKDT